MKNRKTDHQNKINHAPMAGTGVAAYPFINDVARILATGLGACFFTTAGAKSPCWNARNQTEPTGVAGVGSETSTPEDEAATVNGNGTCGTPRGKNPRQAVNK